MYTTGFILVSETGSYEDSREEPIAFSLFKKELEYKIQEIKNANSYLKRYEETRGASYHYFRNYNWAQGEEEFDFREWIKIHPIPEEIIEFVELDENGDSMWELHLEVSFFSIKELTENYKWNC